MPENKLNQSLILFDGVCNLCNSSVQFVIARDKTNHFVFAPLQSQYAKTLLVKHKLSPITINSIVLVEAGKAYIKSTGALKIAKHLSGFWPIMYLFIIVPPFVRNAVYDIVAKNRYKWFGKMDKCMLPTPEIKDKFIAAN